MALVRVPGSAWLLSKLFGTKFFRHNRRTYGASQQARDARRAPARQDRAIRRDLVNFGTPAPRRETLLEWSEALRGFDRTALVVWAAEDRMLPAEHGHRLAELLPRSRYAEIADSWILVPEDQPERLAEELTTFPAETGASTRK